MASLKFNRLELDFQFIKDNYNKPDFKRFVFQFIVPDSKKEPDRFSLLIYALDKTGGILDKKDLSMDGSFVYKAKDRVEFGNIPFANAQVKYFIDADNSSPVKIISLIFKPYDFGDYVAYKVKANPDITLAAALTEFELKPSPPATPEENIL